MKFMVDGVTHELVEINRLTLGELSALEKVTGLTVNQIARLQETCVCGHPAEVKHCTRCDCPGFADVTPLNVSAACMWLSVKRDEPGLTFERACDIPQDHIEMIPEPVEPPKAKKATASKTAVTPTSSD